MQEQTELTTNGITDTSNLKKIMTFWLFVKKHWLALLIGAGCLIATLLVFFAMPIISINNLKIVNLGSAITLKAGDTVGLKASNVSVTVGGFVVDNCPVKGQCFGTNVSAVEYMMTVGGTKYATSSTAPPPKIKYMIQTISSDYKTYVTLKIVKQSGS